MESTKRVPYLITEVHGSRLRRNSMGNRAALSPTQLPSDLNNATCIIEDADTNSADEKNVRFLNVHPLVISITTTCCRDLKGGTALSTIIESIVWPFLARRSSRPHVFTKREYHRFTKSVRTAAERVSAHVSEDNREQSFTKYYLDLLMCRLVNDPREPERPSWLDPKKPLFTGMMRVLLSRALARRDRSFIYSLQKGSKRAWEPLGDMKRDAALLKHRERFSSFHGLISPELAAEIKATSTEVFSRFGAPTKLMPSSSACLQASRRKGGATTLYRKLAFPSQVDELTLGKLRAEVHNFDAWRQETYDTAKARVAQSLSSVPFRADGSHPLFDCKVTPIAEPSKYRIVTAMDGNLCTAVQPAQGLLLECWKKSGFSTMRDDDLTEKVQSMDSEEEFWVSVDYEAATDLLKKVTTLMCLEGLPERFPDRELLMSSMMGNGRARYPDGEKCVVVDGQPMGHPCSFPLLCVINLSVYRLAIKRYRQKKEREVCSDRRALRTLRARLRLMWRNVIVNGDDMLFKSDKEFYFEFFLPAAAEAGLKTSTGKEYFSPHTAMINSQLFGYEGKRGGGQKMVRWGYLNLKLVYGTSVKTGDSAATPTQISRSLNQMCERCHWASAAIPAALQKWESVHFPGGFKPAWGLPTHLGGYGVDPKFLNVRAISKNQRRVAAAFSQHPEWQLFMRASSLDRKALQLCAYQLRWRMVVGDFVENSHESFDLTDDVMTRLTQISQARAPSGEVTFKEIIRRKLFDYRLAPMSDEGIALYSNARFVATKGVVIPPLSVLRVRSGLF